MHTTRRDLIACVAMSGVSLSVCSSVSEQPNGSSNRNELLKECSNLAARLALKLEQIHGGKWRHLIDHENKQVIILMD